MMKKTVLCIMAALFAMQMPLTAMAHCHGGGHHGGCGQGRAVYGQYNPPATGQYNPPADPPASGQYVPPATGQYIPPMCSVEGCHHTEIHLHDNVYYCGHFDGDGCDYHHLCDVEGCLETTEHVHDGIVCLPARAAR